MQNQFQNCDKKDHGCHPPASRVSFPEISLSLILFLFSSSASSTSPTLAPSNMDHTELIKPNDPMSSSPCGSTKILLGKLAPKCRFQVKEWKKLTTGATIMLKRPCVLCVCDMWAYGRNPYIRGVFHVVDNIHGTGNLAVRVHNLRDKPVKMHRTEIRGATFCAFALALDTIDTVPLQLNRVPPRKRDDKKITSAKVTTTSTGSGQKLLRLTATRLKWQTYTQDTRSALLSTTLETIDVRKIGGFDVKTVSDPNTAVAETEIQKGTKILTLRLSHHASHGEPPDSVVILLTVMTKKANVTMKRGTDNVLQKLPSNGFRVQPQRPLKASKGNELTIATDATYASDKYVALFLPYLITGLDISISVWLPGAPLDVRIIATEDVSLPANTPIGELRFVLSTSIRMDTGRQSLLTAPQSQVTARGPGEFKVVPHGIDNLRDENALMARSGTNDPSRDQDSPGDDNESDASISEDEMMEDDVEEEDDDIEYDIEDEDDEENESENDQNGENDENDDEEDSENQGAEEDQDTEDNAHTTAMESPEDDYRTLYRRYMEEDYSPRRRRVPPVNMETWNVVQSVKKMNKIYRQEKDEDDYAYELMIRLYPLDVKLLPSALSSFMFTIPRQAFDPGTDPFYYTFLSREREVVMFNTLRGEEAASSRDGQRERGAQKALRV